MHGILAFGMLQVFALIGLIALIIFWVQYRKRQQ